MNFHSNSKRRTSAFKQFLMLNIEIEFRDSWLYKISFFFHFLQIETSRSEKPEANCQSFELTKPGQGARTHDYYRTSNIPERFDNPGKYLVYSLYLSDSTIDTYNRGNPVFSCPNKVDNNIQTAETPSKGGCLDVPLFYLLYTISGILT